MVCIFSSFLHASITTKKLLSSFEYQLHGFALRPFTRIHADYVDSRYLQDENPPRFSRMKVGFDSLNSKPVYDWQKISSRYRWRIKRLESVGTEIWQKNFIEFWRCPTQNYSSRRQFYRVGRVTANIFIYFQKFDWKIRNCQAKLRFQVPYIKKTCS